MGKKQHQKDKMYLTTTEWSTLYGGKKTGNFLDQFTQLGEFDANSRLEAVARIVGCIYEENDEKTDRRSYTLKRLLRGLASSNRCARIGFTDGLAEVLRRVDYTSDEILTLMDEWLSLKAKEEKGQLMIGRLLAWGAVIRASKFDGLLPKCVEEILSLGEKPFLQNAACALLTEVVSAVNGNDFEKIVWPRLRSYIDGHKGATPFSIFILLTVRRHYPEQFDAVDGKSFLSQKDTMLSVLQMSTSQLPHIHPVVSAIVEVVNVDGNLNEFWTDVVAKLTNSATVEKHYLLLHLIKTAFASNDSLDFLMNEVFVEQLVYPLIKSNSPLHVQAKVLTADLETLAESKAKHILKFILCHNKGYRFDHMTKSSLVYKTLSKADPEIVKWYGKKLQKKLEELQGKDNDETHLKFDTIIIEQLANLTHMSNMHTQTEFKRSICEFLATNYFSSDAKISKKPNTQAFLKALAPPNTPKGLTESADNIAAVLQIYLHMEKRHPSFKREKKVKSASKLSSKLAKCDKDEDTKLALRIFVGYLALSYALNILQDVTVLDDVLSSAKAFMAGRQEEDEVEWIDLIMEAMVSALSIENAQFRSMILMTFALIHKDITAEALSILLAVFKGDEEQEDLTQLEEEASDEEESDESDSDVELSEDAGNKKSEESGSEVDFADAAFRNQLSTVLGVEGSDDEEDEIGATDEDMQQLDKAISAAFGARFKSLSSSSNKENRKKELQALHFEMKCLHIIDAYVKSPAIAMSHLITVSKTLLTFGTSKRAKNIHRPIVSHIAETLRDISCLKVASIKFDNVKVDDIKELGEFAVEKIRTISDAELRVVLNSFLPFIIKCVKNVEDNQEWYFNLYREMINLYLEQQSTPIGPPLFVRFAEVFNEHSLLIVDTLEASLATCIEKRDKRVQVMGLLVAALKLCNTSTLEKKKLKKSLKKLASSVNELINRGEELAYTTNLYVELLDVMRLISRKCQEADLDDQMKGHESVLKEIFKQLSTKNMPSQIKRRLNGVYRHFFPGEQFNLQKRKNKPNGVAAVVENGDVEMEEEQDEPKNKKKKKMNGIVETVQQNGTKENDEDEIEEEEDDESDENQQVEEAMEE